MKIKKYLRLISYLILFSIGIIVLLSIYFSVWGGTYQEGDLEYNIRQDAQIISKSDIQRSSYSNLNEIAIDLSVLLKNIVGVILFPGLFIVFFLRRISSFGSNAHTLQELCVRLDD